MFAIIAVVTFNLHGTATQVAMVPVSFMAPLAIVSAAMLVGIGVVGHFKLPKAHKVEPEKLEPARTGYQAGPARVTGDLAVVANTDPDRVS